MKKNCWAQGRTEPGYAPSKPQTRQAGLEPGIGARTVALLSFSCRGTRPGICGLGQVSAGKGALIWQAGQEPALGAGVVPMAMLSLGKARKETFRSVAG
ncbi:MAG: hypothetical protein AN484_27650 [Aphanizomenon flos-aquae WA102]|uniref:Uncharacterized protein n=1 Tax=Aphanizomenon flos-aquae WA102 TaxID=1710896 RepID=A0A1B7W720_APHFL|nr:MAG: hypothetical protein AN484_27650 [Aphanizomenon flos-aquae WA102]